jgi:hypothetical protein
MTALDRVCAVLNHHQIAYALIGAAALAARGVARSTFDIDLLTTDQRALDAGTWRSLSTDVDIRRGDLDDPLAGVVRAAIADDRPIDVVVGRHAWQTHAVERAERLGNGPPVALARDLVLLKLYAGGAQDLWDIGELLRHGPDALAAQVEDDLAVLPEAMRQRWASFRKTN